MSSHVLDYCPVCFDAPCEHLELEEAKKLFVCFFPSLVTDPLPEDMFGMVCVFVRVCVVSPAE